MKLQRLKPERWCICAYLTVKAGRERSTGSCQDSRSAVRTVTYAACGVWKGEISNMANLDVVDNITVFEVDEILAHRGRGYKVEYLVRWRGFDETYDSWEPTKSLAVAASDAIYQYRQSVPSLKSPKRASLSREKRGPADPVKNERSSTTTTKTVHVTQTVMTEGKNTQSDSSSREGSPTTSRRILRGRKSARDGMKVVDDRAAVKTLDEGAVSQAGCIRTLLTTPCRLCSCVRLRMSDIPIVVLVMSLLVIAITFYA